MVLGGRGSMGYVLGRGAGAAADYPWYLAGGTISVAHVAEWVENPTVSQLYAGGALTGAWTIAARAAWGGESIAYLFDSQTGRVVVGRAAANNGYLVGGAWRSVNLFPDTATYNFFIISDGSTVQAYRDNVAIGSAASATTDIAASGSTRWRSDYTSLGSTWSGSVPRAAIYKIALDATQRAALHVSLAA